jgi:NAD(P)-dependent dehydrogenase (short-subunit alcohol dehydrogenase family)
MRVRTGERPLAGRVVIITGAGRGLGRAFAHEVALNGASVLVNDIDAGEAETVAASIRAEGGTAIATGHSVADAEQCREIIATCLHHFGRLDGLVNNAAVYEARPLAEIEDGSLRRLIDTNLLGPIHCAQSALAPLAASGSGAIVNVISSAGFGLAGRGAYGASKAALLSLTYTWALELASQGIRVNALSPRAVTRLTNTTPGDLGSAEQIAPVVVYLLSDLSRGLTGQCVRASGLEVGWTVPGTYTPLVLRPEPGSKGVAAALAELGPPQPIGLTAAALSVETAGGDTASPVSNARREP